MAFLKFKLYFVIFKENIDMKLLLLISFVAFLSLFSSCSDDSVKPIPTNYLIGKWILMDLNTEPVMTDECSVYEFGTDNVFHLEAPFQMSNSKIKWNTDNYQSYSMDKQNITLAGNYKLIILTLNASKLVYTVQSLDTTIANTYTLTKVSDDYSNKIIGIWSGKCTSGNTTDTISHFWAYSLEADTLRYIHYSLNSDSVLSLDSSISGRYYLTGNLLTNVFSTLKGKLRNYENWNISFLGDKMMWTARRNNDTIVTYEMNKVSKIPYQKSLAKSTY